MRFPGPGQIALTYGHSWRTDSSYRNGDCGAGSYVVVSRHVQQDLLIVLEVQLLPAVDVLEEGYSKG